MVELYLYSPHGLYVLYRASVPVQGYTLPYLSACTRVHFTLPQCLYKGAFYLYLVKHHALKEWGVGEVGRGAISVCILNTLRTGDAVLRF